MTAHAWHDHEKHRRRPEPSARFALWLFGLCRCLRASAARPALPKPARAPPRLVRAKKTLGKPTLRLCCTSIKTRIQRAWCSSGSVCRSLTELALDALDPARFDGATGEAAPTARLPAALIAIRDALDGSPACAPVVRHGVLFRFGQSDAHGNGLGGQCAEMRSRSDFDHKSAPMTAKSFRKLPDRYPTPSKNFQKLISGIEHRAFSFPKLGVS
jgi:hypothetical protein